MDNSETCLLNCKQKSKYSTVSVWITTTHIFLNKEKASTHHQTDRHLNKYMTQTCIHTNKKVHTHACIITNTQAFIRFSLKIWTHKNTTEQK